jgi:uncharacterized membrane protein YkvA (DUF1232 family)
MASLIKQSLATLKRWAAGLKAQISLVWAVSRHPDLPWYCRLWWGLTLAYALSPIDLIPDFIPILGLLDDLILIPVFIAIGLKFTPAVILDAARQTALTTRLPKSRWGLFLVLTIWLIFALICWLYFKRL